MGSDFVRARQQILANDHQRHARGPEILLRAGVDQPVLRDVDRPAEHVGRGVGNERHVADRRLRLPLRAEQRVVGREVHVGGVGVSFSSSWRGMREKFSASVDGRDVDRADALRFLDRLLRPAAGDDVVGGRRLA